MNTSSRINRFKFSPAFSYTRSSYGESAGSKSISALSTCKKEYGFPFTTSLASSLFNTSYGKAATCAAFLLLDEWPETVGFLPHSSLLYTIIRTATTPVILLIFSTMFSFIISSIPLSISIIVYAQECLLRLIISAIFI